MGPGAELDYCAPMRGVLLLFILIGVGCAPATTVREVDVFATGGAAKILRAGDPGDYAAIRKRVRFLHETFGYVPDGSHRELRDLRDLLDREEMMARLSDPAVLAFGQRLRAIDYRMEPRDARALIAGAGGPNDKALGDTQVVSLHEAVAAAGLLAPDAGRDALLMRPDRAAGLSQLATMPGGLERIRAFAAAVPYRYRPSDAGPLADETPLTSAEGEFLTWLARALGTDLRPGQLPELRRLAAREADTRELLDHAAAAKIELGGAGAIMVLARTVRNYEPLTEDEADRLSDLARKLVFPGANEFLSLVPLCRPAGIVDLVDELEDRYHYRFRASDGAGLLVLMRRGLPDPALPDWIVDDRVPILRPELLLSAEPATAFTGENDLRFLEAVSGMRPDLARRSPEGLRRSVQRRLKGREVRYRLGAPYAESAADLTGFLRPDLIKIHLLLDELERPEVVAKIQAWVDRDAGDSSAELGGYIRLTPAGRLTFERYDGSTGTDREDRLHLPPDPVGAALDFHLHATDQDDSAYAGPSSGGPGTDLFRAARHRVDGVVLTRLGDGRTNADMYSSRKYVLDLGVIGRPPER